MTNSREAGRDYAALRRTVGKVLAVAGVVLLVLAVRVVTASRTELLEGNRLLEAGEADLAVIHYRRSAGWYAPGNPFSVAALDKLKDIATSAEEDEDPYLALAAWRAIRGSILSARSFYTPHPDRVSEANRHIAEIMSALPPPPMDRGKGREQVQAEHLELLEGVSRPSPLWTAVMLLGFFTWVFAAYAFATRTFDDQGKLISAKARRWGTLIVLGLGLFVLGLALA
ncbi:MAG: hypothetical protein AAGF12_11135 [Myxococcota bacterium]